MDTISIIAFSVLGGLFVVDIAVSLYVLSLPRKALSFRKEGK